MTTLRGQEWFWVAPGKRCWARGVGKTGVVIKLDDFLLPNPTITPADSGQVGTPAGVLAVYVESCMLTAINNGTPVEDEGWAMSFRMDAAIFDVDDITTPTYAGSPPYMNMLADTEACTDLNAIDQIILPGQWQEFAVSPDYTNFYIGFKLSTSSALPDVVVPVMISLFQSTQG